ncbi:MULTISPECIES: hypothetical protein [Porphyromonadaceae]|uniref:hypothetical protein n=1 Tax=Porphyromonadaceae TaxID=171551 RepID=UPI00073F4082|nr:MULTISPECIES: hypothetical protein [Porphyromonadaceae]
MKNKIVLIVISLFLLCFGAKAQAPLPPDATASPTAFSLYEGEMKEVVICFTPVSGFSLKDLIFTIEANNEGVEVTEGIFDNNTKHLTVKGLKPGRYEIVVTIVGFQQDKRTGWSFFFTMELKLSVIVI